MSKSIRLFMWRYQHTFRVELQMRAEKVLERVGCSLNPEVLLVGVRTPEKTDGFAVCVEPEDGQWNPKLFFDCERRSNDIYSTHPGHQNFYGDAPSMDDKPENIHRSSVQKSIQEAIQVYDTGHDTLSFCSQPTRVEGYFVVPILQFDKVVFESYPALQEPISWNEFKPSSRGLLYSLIEHLLDEATKALVHKDPGRDLDAVWADTQSILRESARDFCCAIAMATRDLYLRDAFEAFNVISSLSYEGSSATGSVVFVSESDETVKDRVRFRAPIPLRKHKLIRKLIETSAGQMVCLYTGDVGVTGLGEVVSPQNVGFRVSFTGHYRWELYFDDTLLMVSSYGVPQMPATRLNRDEFTELAERLFDGIEDHSLDKLWIVVNAAIEQKHGTLIVISANTEKEVARLRRQCLAIDPSSLDAGEVRLLSNIDGAILLDQKGICHAIGVILDGVASDQTDMARGARYNSALRYIASSKAATLCVVVSEDGYVDLLPNLHPQVRRSEIRRHIELLKTQNADDYHKTRTWLDDHRFYLSKEECELVNAEISRIEGSPLVGTENRIVTPIFVPDSTMNDSYYLPEEPG